MEISTNIIIGVVVFLLFLLYLLYTQNQELTILKYKLCKKKKSKLEKPKFL